MVSRGEPFLSSALAAPRSGLGAARATGYLFANETLKLVSHFPCTALPACGSIRQRRFKISGNIRYSPPPLDPGRPRRRHRKFAVFVLQISFSNGFMRTCRRLSASWLGSILRFSDFEILIFEIFGLPTTSQATKYRGARPLVVTSAQSIKAKVNHILNRR